MLLLVGLACLFPLTLYCLFLALVHQRRTPTMISGVWDFAGVLLGLSGFLIVGTSVFLLSISPHGRAFFLGGGTIGDLIRVDRHGNRFTLLLWTSFFLTLGASLAVVLFQRRHFTVLYHLTPLEAEEILKNVLAGLQLSVTRRGPRWYIGYEQRSSSRPIELRPIGPEDTFLVQEFDQLRKAVIDIEGSTALRYVSLHWRFATAALRREIEAELSRQLANFPASEGSVGAWLMTATGSAFILMISCLITFVILALR